MIIKTTENKVASEIPQNKFSLTNSLSKIKDVRYAKNIRPTKNNVIKINVNKLVIISLIPF